MSSLSALQSEVEGLSEWEAQYLLSELQWRRKENDQKSKWLELCDNGSREDIINAAAEYAGVSAIGLASDYERVPLALELVAWAVHRHPRRPVLMRGSKAGRIYRHQLTERGNPNGYAAALFWRYFRAAKITAFDRKDMPIWLEGLKLKIQDRYPHVTHSYHDAVQTHWQFCGRGGCYINGNRRWLEPSELSNLRAMYEIIRKAETLDARMEALRAHRKAIMHAKKTAEKA
jgi:hypothetical protein